MRAHRWWRNRWTDLIVNMAKTNCYWLESQFKKDIYLYLLPKNKWARPLHSLEKKVFQHRKICSILDVFYKYVLIKFTLELVWPLLDVGYQNKGFYKSKRRIFVTTFRESLKVFLFFFFYFFLQFCPLSKLGFRWRNNKILNKHQCKLNVTVDYIS